MAAVTAWSRHLAQGQRLQVLANRVTLSRWLLVVALAAAGAVLPDASGLALALVLAIWLTDVVDGPIARRGQALGAAHRPEGEVIDPVVDDFAYAIGFAILLDQSLVPFAFLALVIAVRCGFTLLRITGLAQGRPFARPRLSGKAMGVSLGMGQIVLFSATAGVAPQLGEPTFRAALVGTMTLACAVALADFVRVNRNVLAAAFSQPAGRARGAQIRGQATDDEALGRQPERPPTPAAAERVRR